MRACTRTPGVRLSTGTASDHNEEQPTSSGLGRAQQLSPTSRRRPATDRLKIQFCIVESDSIKQKSARHTRAQGRNEKNALGSIPNHTQNPDYNQFPHTKTLLIDPRNRLIDPYLSAAVHPPACGLRPPTTVSAGEDHAPAGRSPSRIDNTREAPSAAIDTP